jgi:hypothetical protein
VASDVERLVRKALTNESLPVAITLAVDALPRTVGVEDLLAGLVGVCLR